MVKPILCYGSQIWGNEYSPAIEFVHNMFCKKLLHVRKTTNTCMVLGECGRLPLCITYFTNCIRYWCKLLTMTSDRYPRQCYIMLKSIDDAGRICWATKVKSILFTYGFGYVWISQEIGDCDMFINVFRNRLIDCFTQNWHDTVSNSSRCHHYSHFKTLLNIERYLIIEMPAKHKIAYAKFRCSNHKLQVETGRHLNITFQNRVCNVCSQININMTFVDCEYHAFFHCTKYTSIRNQFLFNWYNSGTDLNNFYDLLSTNDFETIRKLAVYIFYLMNSIKD
ncbi:hypothetical protein DPMN_015986 [Dreissena polymorpha]|uniref:Uncharacterized protein n=1 Tax=Dreissena polymorpha TaxID=45954 RepID=A0A9D4NC20_DREPO|nr:hypothetical protein DPMN_015986 [Dreissena polymorpha]